MQKLMWRVAQSAERKIALKALLLASSVASIGLVGSPALAQTAPAGANAAVEEVVVTARRRDESLVDVPVAITALSATDIAKYGASDLTTIAQLVPQVQVNTVGPGGTGAIVAIRGVATQSFDVGLDQSVSVNLDGVQISRGRVVYQGFFDLAGVEVLKGPQALFFGKNSPGGVISLKSAGPTDELAGYVKAGYETRAHEKTFDAAIGGPVTDTLGIRLAVRARDLRGWIRNEGRAGVNPFGALPIPEPKNKWNGSEEQLGRLTVAWTPTDRVDVTLKAQKANYSDDGGFGETFFCPGGATNPKTRGVADPSANCTHDRRVSLGDLQPAAAVKWPYAKDGVRYSDYQSNVDSLTINYRGEGFTVTSVTGWVDYRNVYLGCNDGTVYCLVAITEVDKYKAGSQELRYATNSDGPVNGMVGLYYQDTSLFYFKGLRLFDNGVDPATGKYENLDDDAATDGKTYSAFAQLMWNIQPNLELSGGLRWTRACPGWRCTT